MLLPQPVEVHAKPGNFRLDDSVVFNPPLSAALTVVTERFAQRLKTQTGISLQRHGNNNSKRLNVVLTGTSSPIPQPDMQEQYQLSVGAQQITLLAASQVGLNRGIETLLQLIQQDSAGYYLPQLEITDAPRFAWRGLLLDPARRFLPIDVLYRQLDIMAAAKLNVLHLHLTDDQGWRFESKAFPLLHQVGGKDGFYSQDELKQLVTYAAGLGIRVVPEIDLPGHTTALGAACPQLMAQAGPTQPERHWGVHPAVLDPSKPEVYQFIQTLLSEVASVFPDPYLHIGGDEVLPEHWLQSADIARFMQQQQLTTPQQLHSYFNRRLQQILQQLNKRMIGWDEVLDSDLPTSVLVQSWRGTESLYKAAQAGHPAILSTGYYLDQPQIAAFHYRNDPLPTPTTVPDLSQFHSLGHWQFELARKRGAAVKAELMLLNDNAGTSAAILQFAGRNARYIENFTLNANQLQFETDSWMGPVQARLTLQAEVSGEVVVGNAAYTATGQQLHQAPPLQIDNLSISPQAAANILGGEITLWGELVTPENIDIRLWPNGFAVAERLWSTSDVTDPDSLYQRLTQFSHWATLSAGLATAQQQQAGLARIAAPAQADVLATLTQILEPAHYYHRLHEKSVAGLYHADAPLNQLADYLSAENPKLRNFSALLQAWLQHPEPDNLQALLQQMQHWQQAADQLQGITEPMSALVMSSQRLLEVAINTLQQYQQQGYISLQAQQALDRQLSNAAGIEQEIIIALHRPLRLLLQHLPLSRHWVAPGTFSASAEGPAFDSNGNLYAVNYGTDGTIGIVSPDGNARQLLQLPDGSIANGIVFDQHDVMYMADYTGHQVLRYQHGKLSVHAAEPLMNQPNDLAILKNGTLFASDPNWQNSTGQLWRIDTDGSSHLLEDAMGTTNGIAVSPDQQFLYVNESVQRRIWRYRLGTGGTLTEKTLFASFSDYGLDGMRTNEKGDLFVARYGKGTVVRLNATGQVVAEYRLQHALPTNVALSRTGPERLFVTIQQCGCIEVIDL
ncbi:family 20 glycosylhydrolase [Rheinheimera maricola]|uniref:N-acetyl-beta-glucosaminidase n=1 Tax=Rheinheimera maricola TaxID=2793282 RepID=A0ABS7X817_9GAMM|nr:family 20 glycosylhydrolase [Rheinheimera maricola]MBZ9610757.1 family 20 glycosylhydrolase [Rheinheimera maricola]